MTPRGFVTAGSGNLPLTVLATTGVALGFLATTVMVGAWCVDARRDARRARAQTTEAVTGWEQCQRYTLEAQDLARACMVNLEASTVVMDAAVVTVAR